MKKTNTKNTIFSALCTVFLVLSAWITVPSAVPFTMQTFAVAFFSAFLGAKSTVMAITSYILLGIFGLPVFSGFQSGAATIFGATGGYTLGFIPFSMIAGTLYKKLGKSFISAFFSMLSGLIACYIAGTLWYAFIYLDNFSGIKYILSVCVLPFIIPDILKLSLAAVLVGKAERIIKRF